MVKSWQIDAVDPRGGVAFASWRNFSLIDETTELREAPSVTIVPPFFHPEPLATRVLARSAPRGSFQIGVFAGEGEVAFTSLEAVTEFVRRIYIRSSGSDGAEGGGSPVPTAPRGGGDGGAPALPPLPTLPTEPPGGRGYEPPYGMPGGGAGPGGPAGPDVLGLLQGFAALSAQQGAENPVVGHPLKWAPDGGPGRPALPPTVAPFSDPHHSLTWAALLLIREMLARLPASRDLSALLTWQRSATALGSLIAQLELWDRLFEGQAAELLFAFMSAIGRSAGTAVDRQLTLIDGIPTSREKRTRTFYWLLFGAAPAMDHEDWIAWMRDVWGALDRGTGYAALPSLAFTVAEADALDTLKVIPLPPDIEHVIAPEGRADATLYHLLAAAAGAPGELLEVSRVQDGIALVLFAACAVVLEDGGRQATFGSLVPASGALSLARAQRLVEVMTRAWQWLSESLPRMVFPASIERMIAESTSLRYGDDWTGGGVAAAPNQPLSPTDDSRAQELPAYAFAAA